MFIIYAEMHWTMNNLVNDSENYSGEPTKAISISVTELFTETSA